MGARVVNVHGETVMEPVEPGPTLAAVSSANVDILAHPGLITPGDAAIAASNGVFLEVSARRGHGLANGHVVKTARRRALLWCWTRTPTAGRPSYQGLCHERRPRRGPQR